MAHREFRRELPGSTSVVLFIHGIQGSPDQFEFLYDSVPAHWSIVNILLDGHGGSVKDFSRTSMKKWKAQVQEVTDNLAARYDEILIVGHSMGTFFAMDSARRLPEKVKGLFMLATPLVISVKPRAGINSMRVVLTSPPDRSPVIVAARKAYSIEQDKRLWRYLGWIPRYLELFRESKRQRMLIAELKTPCRVFQSANDELVSLRSCRYIERNPDIVLTKLPGSGHFYYPPLAEEMLAQELEKMCAQVIR